MVQFLGPETVFYGRVELYQENKYVPQRIYGGNRTARPSVQDEAAGQPPDYNQTMNLHPFLLQPTNRFQYGYQINGTGLSQQQLSNQQSFLASPTLDQVNGQEMGPAPSQTLAQQCLGTVKGMVRGPTEKTR